MNKSVQLKNEILSTTRRNFNLKHGTLCTSNLRKKSRQFAVYGMVDLTRAHPCEVSNYSSSSWWVLLIIIIIIIILLFLIINNNNKEKKKITV